MRLSWTVAAAVAIGGPWAAPALAFGHKHGCGGGTTGVTTVTTPATVTTTRTTFVSTPAVVGSVVTGGLLPTPNVFTGAVVTGGLLPTPNVVATPTFFNATPTVALMAPTVTNFTGGTVASNNGCATDAKLDQVIAKLDQLNTTLATKLGGGMTPTPTPGLPTPNVFGPATVATDGTSPLHAYQRHEAAFNAALAAGNPRAALHQWEDSVAHLNQTRMRWEDANKRMEATLRERGIIK